MLWLWLLLCSICAAMVPGQELKTRARQSPDNVIHVQADEFERFFNSSNDRDYFMVTLISAAHKEANCNLCQNVQPVFEEIAATVGKKEPRAPVFFVDVDIQENLANVKRYGIKSVPQLWIYPPVETIYKTNDSPFDTRVPFPATLNVTSEHYQFTVSNEIPENELEIRIARWVSQVCQVNVQIDKGLDYDTLAKSFLGFTIVFKLAKKGRAGIYRRLTDWKLYCGMCMFLVCFNMSGINFCMQRAVPFLSRAGSGAMIIMTGGSGYQQGVEVVISMLFQLGFSIFLIALLLTPTLIKDVGNRGLVTCIACVGLFAVYNTFTTAYMAKDHGYPFNVVKMFEQDL